MAKPVIAEYAELEKINKMAYSTHEVKEILKLSMRQTYQLLAKKPFPIIIAVKTKLIPIRTFHKWALKNYPNIKLPDFKPKLDILGSDRTSYTVPEIRTMLGMKKTTSYELIKTGVFKTIMIDNHIRVNRESFEDWFHSQDYLYINEEEK